MSGHKLEFLESRSFFYKANQKISDASENDLINKCQSCIQEAKVDEAIPIAQKLSIQYGLPGLYLYIPLRIQQLQREYKKHEVVAEDLKKTLSLIYYIEKNFPSEKQSGQLEANKKNCIEMLDPRYVDEISTEAQELSLVYPKPCS